tara:strand:- start:4447 stop:7677 length:3231 start_codon:yes stop_codon:yes gene_type:complete
MAIEKNPNDISKPIDIAKDKLNNQSQALGIDVNIKEEQEEDLAVNVDPLTGEVEIDLNEDSGKMLASISEDFYTNLAELLEDEQLEEISATVLDNYQSDKDSREEWEQTFERGFDLLGLKLEETTEPFDGACTATHPLIIENAVKFQSKASQELFPSKGPVKTQIVGAISPEKEKQAQRVKDFMNYQLTEEMPEYFDEFEKMLFHLPLIGTAVKKVYYDETVGRPISEFIPIDQFHVSNLVSDLRRADRYTHVIYRTENDLRRDMDAGMYRDLDIGDPEQTDRGSITSKAEQIMGLSAYDENPYDPSYVLLEQHLYLDLPEPFNSPSGVAYPYIVTIDKSSKQVLSIRRNWNDGDPRFVKREHFVSYKFVPGFGFYGLGLIHFLGNLTMSATAAMRALIDAGQFSNLPGGFKARGVRVVGDNSPIMPGEFRDVEATGLDLGKSIVPLPYKEPSQTLYQMLGFVAGAGQKFADTTDQVVSDATNYGPVGTTLALLEASGKFFSAIHKRLHKSQKDEFKILARINNEFLPTTYPYDIIGQSAEIFKQDFDGRVDVVPVSDPNIPSNSHRLAQAQLMLQLASQSPPGTFNIQEINKAVLAAANVDNPDRFINPTQQGIQQDPLADIMSATKGQPIKAFPGQDHDAHIAVKTAYLQDPLNGANPIMKMVEPILLANVREHMVLRFQEQMGGLMKAQEGQVDQGASLTMIMAESAKQILQANQLAAQGGLDSIEQQNLNIQKQAIDNKKELENKELALKEKQINIDAMVEAAKIEESKKTKSDGLTAKVVMDLLKLVDKQKLQEGGVVTQSADDFKKAADLAVKKPLNTPDPKNFLEMAFAAQGIDPQRSYKERMAREQQAQIVPDPVPLPPVETDEELQKISEIQEKEIDMPITDEMKQLTYRQEIGKNSTKIHHPTPTSGITVGAGYDMKGRTSEEIIEDLTMAGVDADVAGQISKAAGLSGDEAKQFMKDNKGLGITEDQQLKLFDTVFANTVIRTQNQLRNMGYNPKDIPENKLILLVDYVYNTGSLFPKFTKAIIDNDYETAKKEYKRYSGDKELTRRNKATLSYIKELEKDTQIG